MNPVRSDESAVAGFFEDMPVLLIILAGVAVLVISGTFAGERMRDARNQEELDVLASRFVDSVIMSMSADPYIEHVSLSAIHSVNITRCATETFASESYKISFLLCYPNLERIRSASSLDEFLCEDTGYSSLMMNVVLNDGTIGVAEVSAIVWR